ncbi:MAG: hypothetical protein HKO93_06990, partial [Flavobacteriales bacterium]|nr:hypothetical protein [Flavobacteriales bacterium]
MSREKGIYLILCSLILSYIIIRSIHVPLVHDEVATYVHFIVPGEFIPGQSLVDANNHHLNSLLSVVSYRLFGLNSLGLRLPNVFFFIILAVYTWGFSRRFKNPLIQWAFILSIIGSHYLIEFYGLCRGYGIAMACFNAALYYIHRFADEEGLGSFLGFLLCTLLCLSASLTFLFPSLILFALSMYFLMSKKRALVFYLLALLGIVLLYSAISVSLWLKSGGALYYGAEGSFWEKTVGTLSRLLVGENLVSPYVFTIMALFVLGSTVSSLIRIFDRTVLKKHILHLVFLGSLIGIFLSHYLMGTHYPEDRVALYLFPLLIGALLMSIEERVHVSTWIRWTVLILFYFPIHFLMNMNTSHVDFWFRERIPDTFYQSIEDFEVQTNRPPTVSGYHTTALTYFMNANLHGYDVPALLSNGFPNESADFIITRINEDSLSFADHQVVHVDKVSGNKLWRRVKPLAWKMIDEVSNIQPEHKNEFFEMMRLKVDANSHYIIDVTLDYQDVMPPSKIHLVMSMKDEQGQDLQYVPYELHWRRPFPDSPISTTLYADGSGEKEDELVVYLWNIQKHLI